MTRDLAIATVIALALHAVAIVAVGERRSTPTVALDATPQTLSVVLARAPAATPRESTPEPFVESGVEPPEVVEAPPPEVVEAPPTEVVPELPVDDVAPEPDPVTPEPPRVAAVEPPPVAPPTVAPPVAPPTVATEVPPVAPEPTPRPLVMSRGWPWIPLSAIAATSSSPPDETPPPEPLARRAVDLEPVRSVPPPERSVRSSPPKEQRHSLTAASEPDPDRVEPVETAASGATRQPVVSRNPRPTYPRVARQRGYEGEVLLRVEVLETGSVGDVDVQRSSGHRVLDRAAIRAVRRWRFEPATRLGTPVSTWIEVPVEFDIEEGD